MLGNAFCINATSAKLTFSPPMPHMRTDGGRRSPRDATHSLMSVGTVKMRPVAAVLQIKSAM
jgi:hypothetical protein